LPTERMRRIHLGDRRPRSALTTSKGASRMKTAAFSPSPCLRFRHYSRLRLGNLSARRAGGWWLVAGGWVATALLQQHQRAARFSLRNANSAAGISDETGCGNTAVRFFFLNKQKVSYLCIRERFFTSPKAYTGEDDFTLSTSLSANVRSRLLTY
jgi:hypothetical protein